jgi:hypothetical protein
MGYLSIGADYVLSQQGSLLTHLHLVCELHPWHYTYSAL